MVHHRGEVVYFDGKNITFATEKKFYTMKIHRIEINNFRCFEHLELELNLRLNVFVGVNGSGKTAILEAVKLGVIGVLGQLKGAVPQQTVQSGYKMDPAKDARISIFEQGEWVQADHCSVSFLGQLDTDFVSWQRGLEKRNVKYSHTNDTKQVKPYFDALNKALQVNDNVELPLFSYHSTGRLFLENKDTKQQINGRRIDGYMNAQTAKSSQYLFKNWFVKHQKGKDTFGKHNISFDFAAFEQVKRVIVDFIPNCKAIDYDGLRLKDIFFVFEDGSVQPYSTLSDGFRNLIALVSDLVLRAAVLNPWMGENINHVHGVVLIDEVDLHLHPAWQRQVVPSLLRAFPNVQFFVTTHSPQVLSKVAGESVFVLEDNQIKSDKIFTEGRDSNSILEDVFETPVLDRIDQNEVNQVYDLIVEGKKAQAESMLNQTLLPKRGESDREVQRIKSYLEFL
jgi:predicted ATP-binding protein involved in virulence